MMRRGKSVALLLATLTGCLTNGLTGCKADSKSSVEVVAPPAQRPEAKESNVPRRGPPQPRPTSVRFPTQTHFNIPTGPPLGIQPGKGIGPIRFGATIATIERLMESKCLEKTESLCRYAAQAVEFRLESGGLAEIRIHGDERPFGGDPELTYGIFNGFFLGDVRLGMYRQFVVEKLGEPTRFEEVVPGKFQTVRRDFYPSMVLEYDKLANGNVVLAGVVLTKPAPDSAAAPSATVAPASSIGKASQGVSPGH